jgi:hypothetical protein
VCRGFDSTIRCLVEAIPGCEDPERRRFLIDLLNTTVGLKIDAALVLAALEWNSPALATAALLLYSVDAAPDERARELFAQNFREMAVLAIGEVMAKPEHERLVLLIRSGIVFIRALEVSGSD